MVTAEYERPGGWDGQQLFVELAARTAAAAVDTGMWQAWLADPDTRRRFGALVYRRCDDHCAFWLGAISSTGHGKFRAGSRAQAQAEAGPAMPSRIVSAHVYAYQLHHGVIAMAPWAGQVVIRHRCDETSCENWDHLLIGHPARQRPGLPGPPRPRGLARQPTAAAPAAGLKRSGTRS